jgi:toxin ParE1/3/4
MSYLAFLTDDAARNIEDLYGYIVSHDAPEKADYLLDKIEEAPSSLSENPERGTYPQ